MYNIRFALLFAIAFAALFLGSFSVRAQETGPPTCGSDLEEALKAHPEYRADMERHREFVRRREAEAATAAKTFDLPEDTESWYIIPCVVHVVWGERVDSISKARVRQQFVDLFNDLRVVPGTRGFGAGADTRVELALATIGPDGKPTDGILYHYDPELTDLRRGRESDELKQKYSWDRKKYLNFWLCSTIVTQGGQPLGGYAHFPNFPSDFEDGIVVKTETWGTGARPGEYDATATHEVGHWINLFHTFQGGCGDHSNCEMTGDGVCDTPPVANSEFKRPSERMNTCTEGSAETPDNPRNYMDYSSPSIQTNVFTAGQARRAILTMQDPGYYQRYPLWQDDNLEETGAGPWGEIRAYFWSDRQHACPGQQVRMTSYSAGRPHVFEWIFEGGEPATSNEQYPEVAFAEPGAYDVTLIVENLSGRRDTMVREDFIIIDGAEPRALPFTEDFEAEPEVARGLPEGWRADKRYYDTYSISEWRHNAFVGFEYDSADPEPQGALEMPLYTYAAFDHVERLNLPALNLSSAQNPLLSFRYAYSPLIHENKVELTRGVQRAYINRYSDTLAVQISDDCGETWTDLWRSGGENMKTTAATARSNDRGENGLFAPKNDNDWGEAVIDLAAYAGAPDARLRLEVVTGFGNNLFFDNFVVEDVVSVAEPVVRALEAARLAPNPSADAARLLLDLPEPARVTLEVFDLSGKKVAAAAALELSPGNHELEAPVAGLPAGVFQLRVGANERARVLRLIRR